MAPTPADSTLPPHVEKILNDFVAACKKSFAERLSSIVLFGSAAEGRMRATSDVNVIVVLNEYQQRDVADMAQTLRLARAVIRLDVMYLLANEVHSAIECFAQKFGDIVRRHRILHGDDPFQGLSPSRGAEAYRLRQVIFNLQLCMRQGYAVRAGQDDQVALLLADIAGPLRTCAATLSRLENQGTFAPKEALERLVNSIGREELVIAIRDISEIRERRAPSSPDLSSTFFLILEIVERNPQPRLEIGMNPFELPGPLFLIFFGFMGCVMMAGLVWVRRAWEPDPTIPVHLTDPYEIACLRGGSNEVLRLATTGLIDRGLLQVEGKRLKVENKGLAQLVRNPPLERAILEHFWTGNDITSMFSRASLRREGEAFEVLLQQRGLISDKDARVQQLLTCVGAIGVLWVTAVTKIEIAMERGYAYNFLALAAILFTLAALSLSLVRKTRRGDRFLKDMQTLFDPLRHRPLQPNVNTTELLLMGAVFGMVALPAGTFPYINQLFPHAAGGVGSVSGCGGSSCGSSCGGGGGGCGGCGS